MNRSMPRLLLAAACTLGLLACAQGPRNPAGPVLPPPNLLDEASGPTTALLRVVVRFKEPVAYADAAFVKTLQDQVQAPVRYLSAISRDTHVYGVQWPASQDRAAALQRLAALPSVAHVEPDTRAKAQ